MLLHVTNDPLHELERLTERLTVLRGEVARLEVRRAELREIIRASIPVENRPGPPAAILQAKEAIVRAGREVTVQELADLLSINTTAATIRLNRGFRLGLFRRTGRGKYAVAEESSEKQNATP